MRPLFLSLTAFCTAKEPFVLSDNEQEHLPLER
jgi:hypothetical protein